MFVANRAQLSLLPLGSVRARSFESDLQPRAGTSTDFTPKSRRIRTYAKHAHNPFAMNTSKTNDLKSFRIRTYRKKGRGVARTSLSASSALHSLRVSGYSAPLCYLFPSLRLFNLRLSTALLTAPYSTTHCPRPFDKASSLV
jgi:hypothetical protein